MTFEFTAASDVQKWVCDYLKRKRKTLDRERRRGVVVFDIDGTLIRDDRDNVKIHAMHAIYACAKRLGYRLFIVTARPNMRNIYRAGSTHEPMSNATMTALEIAKAGYDPKDFEKIYLMPTNLRPSVATWSKFKHACRVRIAAKTREPVVLNLGDQWSDLFLMPPHVKNEPRLEISSTTTTTKRKSRGAATTSGQRRRVPITSLPRSRYYIFKHDGVTSVKMPDRS